MHEISIINDDEVNEEIDYIPITFPERGGGGRCHSCIRMAVGLTTTYLQSSWRDVLDSTFCDKSLSVT